MTRGRAQQAAKVKALAAELLGMLAQRQPPVADGTAALMTAAAVLLAAAIPNADRRRAAAAAGATAWIAQVMDAGGE